MMSSHLFVFLISLFMGIKWTEGGAQTYNEILESLQRPENLVFDISQHFTKALLNNPSSRLEDNQILVNLGVCLSPINYFGADVLPFFGLEGITNKSEFSTRYPQPINYLRHRCKNSTIPFGTCLNNFEGQHCKLTAIVNLPALYSLHGDSYKEYVHRLIMSLKKGGMEVGLECDPETCQTIRPFNELFDVIIVNVHIPPEDFVLSYSSYKTKLEDYDLVKKLFPFRKVYVKLDQHHLQIYGYQRTRLNLTQKTEKMYYIYLLRFSVFWLNEEKDRSLILPPFNISTSSEVGLDGVDWRKLVVADMSPLISSRSFPTEDGCAWKGMMNQLGAQFKRVSLKQRDLLFSGFPLCLLTHNQSNFLCDENTTESKLCNRPSKNISMPSITLDYGTKAAWAYDADITDMYFIKSRLHGLPWELIEISVGAHPENDVELEGIIHNELPPQVGVASGRKLPRTFRPPPEVNKMFYPIYETDIPSGIWNGTKVLIWKVLFDVKVNNSYYFEMGLENVNAKREEFLKLHPDKSVMLETFFVQTRAGLVGWTPYGLYCNDALLRGMEFVEGMINFARVHNIHIKLEGVLGGWSQVKTLDEIEEITAKKFPHFVARNYPDKFLLGEFHTDPCIPWTREVLLEGMKIGMEYAGTTLYLSGMKNVSVSKEELEIMLQFAFHKFGLIELKVGSITDMETVFRVLENNKLLEKIIRLEKRATLNLYLEVDLSQLETKTLKYFLKKVTKLAWKPKGIHFKGFGNGSEALLQNSYFKTLQADGILVGVSVDECLDEVANGFGSLSNLHQFSKLDYFLCNVEYVVGATNLDSYETGKYLDTTLYITKYFQRLFPETPALEILFRLNHVRMAPGPYAFKVGRSKITTVFINSTTAEFLKFFSDVNHYAQAYKLKMFMLPTFDTMEGQHGWWQISNFERLTNTSVFVEREAEFIQRETWRPSVEAPDTEMEVGWIKFLILGMGALLLIMVGVIIILRVWYGRKYDILTRNEVDSFWNGTSADDPGDHVFNDGRKFPEEFEIPRSRFVLVNIIGQGNFGLVYNATLSDGAGGSLPVAVKIPHPGCSKDSFKSMLAELKVISYVGSHPHVLEFIGAFTKEIGRGIAYIATELCKGGALQEYLRKLHSTLSEEQSEEGPLETGGLKRNQYELYRFAHEISMGMEYIAGRKVIHGDLSTRNVLLDSNLVCKIGDFGLSKKLYEYKTYVKDSGEALALPWRWLAIESLKKLEFTTKSDVWSYGVTLWEIFSLGCVPYPGLTYTNEFVKDLENGYRMSIPDYATEVIFEEMKRCWEMNPEMRPSFAEMAQFFGTVRSTDYSDIIIG